MPSKTKKQAKVMQIACAAPGKSKAKIPQDVACEYAAADRRKQRK
jgi:hypothetical protein